MSSFSRTSICLAFAFAVPAAMAQEDGPLPKGPGVNLVYATCQECHPISYVVESAGLPDFLWQDTLNLMKQLGMKVTEQQEETLYTYLTTYLGTEPPPEPEAETGAAAEVDGAAVYAGSCAVCHGADGQGTPGAFPPLAGHVGKLAAADRDYLPLPVLYGLSGEIEIEGHTYNGVMPPWSQLSDDEVAAILNSMLERFGGAGAADLAPYTAEEIESARGLGLSTSEVLERRPEIP